MSQIRSAEAGSMSSRFQANRDNSIMANDDFAKVQQQLETAASELKTANDPERRRILLREMSRLLAEAQRISSQPLKMSS